MKSIFPENTDLLGKVLDLRLERQNVVMSNLSNQDVPAYKARRLEFENELQSALGLETEGKLTRTGSKHLSQKFSPATFTGALEMGWKPRVVAGLDSVDMDKEMSIMAKNTLMYNALTEITKKGFEGMQKVLAEGGK